MAAAKAKFFLVLLVAALLGLLVMLDARRREAEMQLQELTVKLEQLQGDNPEQNKEVARQIVAKVRAHVDIPVNLEPTVAQIVDAQKLKANNPFYSRAENGDYLVITPTRAILYSPKKDIVLDVIPVQITQQPQLPVSATGADKDAAASAAKKSSVAPKAPARR